MTKTNGHHVTLDNGHLPPLEGMPPRLTDTLNQLIDAYQSDTLRGAMLIGLLLRDDGVGKALEPVSSIVAENPLILSLVRDETHTLLSANHVETAMKRNQAAAAAAAAPGSSILGADGQPLA